MCNGLSCRSTHRPGILIEVPPRHDAGHKRRSGDADDHRGLELGHHAGEACAVAVLEAGLDPNTSGPGGLGLQRGRHKTINTSGNWQNRGPPKPPGKNPTSSRLSVRARPQHQRGSLVYVLCKCASPCTITTTDCAASKSD